MNDRRLLQCSILAVLVPSFGFGEASCRILSENIDSTIQRIVAVCPGRAERTELGAHAKDLAKRAGGASIADVIVGTDEAELLRSVVHRSSKSSDDGFDAVIERLRREGSGLRSLFVHPPLLRLLRIGNVSVETYVNRSNPEAPAVLEERVQPSGAVDPRIWRVHPRSGRLEWLELHDSPAFGSRQVKGFVVAPPSSATCETCRGFLEQLKLQLGMSVTGIEMRVRSNVWFSGGYFPLVFRFGLDGQFLDGKGRPRVPTVEDYYHGSSEAWCNWDRPTPRVACTSFEPRSQ